MFTASLPVQIMKRRSMPEGSQSSYQNMYLVPNLAETSLVWQSVVVTPWLGEFGVPNVKEHTVNE